MRDRQTAWTVAIIATVSLAIIVGMSSLARPAVAPAGSATGEFSAEKAMAHVRAIAQAPHPIGSPEIARVRGYIVAELESMGLDPEVQETSIIVPRGSLVGTTIRNIVVKIPGSSSSGALLLDAHYDTRAMTPGAADCSSCVATVIETARAMLASSPLRNDVVLLFTDNEEYGGGLGAAAFIDEHPWANDIAVVLNFEGLGSTGPSLLFETGPESAWLVRDWGHVAERPVGQSWFNDVYRLTPISTDLDWFSDAGVAGINLGFWARGTAYHATLDTPQALDVRSLQHHGSHALALVQHLGNLDMTAPREPRGDAIYFGLWSGAMVTYPASWALPITILLGALLAGTVIAGKRARQLTLRGALRGMGLFLLSLLTSSGLATGIWLGIVQLHNTYQAMLTFRGVFYNTHFYLFAFVSLTIAIWSTLVVIGRKKTVTLDMLTGVLLCMWLLAATTSVLSPGFSYLFAWPILFSTLSLMWRLWRGSRQGDPDGSAQVALMLGPIPAIILYAPSIYVMYHFALAPMIGILALMSALLLGLLVPQIDVLTRNHRWRLPLAACVVCIGLLLVGSTTAGFNLDRPRPNAAAYLLNADSGEATWFSAGTQQDDWTRQFLAEEPSHSTVGELFPVTRGSRFPVMKGTAPTREFAAPDIHILDDTIKGDTRTLRFRIQSNRDAPVLILDVKPHGAVRAAEVDKEPVGSIRASGGLWSITYYGAPPEGLLVDLELDTAQPVKLQITDHTWPLTPEMLSTVAQNISPRSSDMMPMPNFDWGTAVVRTYELE